MQKWRRHARDFDYKLIKHPHHPNHTWENTLSEATGSAMDHLASPKTCAQTFYRRSNMTRPRLRYLWHQRQFISPQFNIYSRKPGYMYPPKIAPSTKMEHTQGSSVLKCFKMLISTGSSLDTASAAMSLVRATRSLRRKQREPSHTDWTCLRASGNNLTNEKMAKLMKLTQGNWMQLKSKLMTGQGLWSLTNQFGRLVLAR